MKKLILLAATALLTATAAYSADINNLINDAGLRALQPDTKTIDFRLDNLSGNTVSLNSFRGHVVLLNFWASWCAPCQEEMPSFVKWQSQYHGKLQVIGVTMDDATPKAQATAKKLKVNYPIVAGTAPMARSYGGIYGLPVTFLIDAQGRIRAEYQGGNHLSQIHAEIQRLLTH